MYVNMLYPHLALLDLLALVYLELLRLGGHDLGGSSGGVGGGECVYWGGEM